MNLDQGAVQRYRLDPDANNLRLLQLLKHPIQHTAFAPAAHTGVDGVPIAEAFGQTAPLAVMFSHIQNDIQYAHDIAPLERDQMTLKIIRFSYPVSNRMACHARKP